MTPMAAIKSSTLNSLRVLVVTFLKNSPAFLVPVGADAGAAPRFWAAVLYTIPKPLHRVTAMAAVSISRDESFMSFTSVRMQPDFGHDDYTEFGEFWDRHSEFCENLLEVAALQI